MTQLLSLIFLTLIPTTLLFGGLLAGSQGISDVKRSLILKAVKVSLIILAISLTASFILTAERKTEGFLAITGMNLVVLLLVSFMAIVLIKFSERYLFAEKNAHQYWRWLLLCLAAVSIVVLSNHLLLFWLAWVAISICFHKLLLFYPDRPRAVLAAHKKFLLARLAEAFLLTAILLLYWQHGTFQLSALTEYYLTNVADIELGFAEKSAAIFIALTALIKCAQLPVHGWLVQVVEAPTPVSALLHAGIINLGGFLLLTFAPLLAFAPAAKWLIIIVAGVSTVLSALVMMTRISVKVRLAWSTCAQMGLMLIECALGLYELALLHLLTHSLYKAYMFLSAGEELHRHSVNQLGPLKKETLFSAAISLCLAISGTAGIIILTEYQGPISIWLLVTTSLALYLVSAVRNNSPNHWLYSGLTVLLLLSFYLMGKALFAQLVPQLPTSSMFDAMDIWLSILLTALFILAVQIHIFSKTKATQTLYRWLFSGLYLDEIMTRLTLSLWPVTLRPKLNQTSTDQQSIKEYWV